METYFQSLFYRRDLPWARRRHLRVVKSPGLVPLTKTRRQNGVEIIKAGNFSSLQICKRTPPHLPSLGALFVGTRLLRLRELLFYIFCTSLKQDLKYWFPL